MGVYVSREMGTRVIEGIFRAVHLQEKNIVEGYSWKDLSIFAKFIHHTSSQET